MDLRDYHNVIESILISLGIPCRVLCLVFLSLLNISNFEEDYLLKIYLTLIGPKILLQYKTTQNPSVQNFVFLFNWP